MNIDVYDTYVRRAEGVLLHSDVLLPVGEGSKAIEYAHQWLLSIGRTPEEISLENSRYCHTQAASPTVQQHIRKHGYFIFEMQSCPAPAS